MARLLPGENPKIDRINEIVAEVKDGNMERMNILLEMFHPMLLSICTKWCVYFGDESHTLIPFDVLMSDAQFWFICYTKEKYTIDGLATYNKFMKDHMLQRIRYIYECELKYRKRNIFPDPDKNAHLPDNDRSEMLDSVVYNYSCCEMGATIEEDFIEKQEKNTKDLLASAILIMLEDKKFFTERERTIFIECDINGVTHNEMGERLGISRTRVSQIMARTKEKLMIHMNTNRGIKKLLMKWRA